MHAVFCSIDVRGREEYLLHHKDSRMFIILSIQLNILCQTFNFKMEYLYGTLRSIHSFETCPTLGLLAVWVGRLRMAVVWNAVITELYFPWGAR